VTFTTHPHWHSERDWWRHGDGELSTPLLPEKCTRVPTDTKDNPIQKIIKNTKENQSGVFHFSYSEKSSVVENLNGWPPLL
jgi:hypothetical protein